MKWKTIIVLAVVLLSSPAWGQQNFTTTTSVTSTNLTNNPTFGCVACAAIQNHDPATVFPDTSVPFFAGDPRAAQLPAIIAKALPPNNQFGVGIPLGSDGFTTFNRIPFKLADQGLLLSVDNIMVSAPATGGGKNNTFNLQLRQTTPGAHVSGGDQVFAILFSIKSLTGPDGNLVGTATGTFTQDITEGGVTTTTTGTIQFDSTNGFTGTNLHNFP
jgi:hypothetical protein